MPVAKLKASSNTDVMKTEEGNETLDTFIRQAIGKEPFLSFSRTGDSPVQWFQLLHALDQQDLPGWPLLTPLKVQMQKCEKCSQEFCSSINYRRHIRVHHRLKKLDKDTSKNRDLLGTFWDKLSEDEAKEILSFKDVSLEEVPGSSIIKSLVSLIRKPGFSSLPQYCMRAGSALLDIIQGRPSRFPLSSEDLFGFLDDASERTFLCGTAVSMQKYIFDGEAGKIGLETKNLVACTSFLLEQQLIKAWLADMDAEALRCQKLLVEEEEAAQRRQAELLEKKRKKKLKQKEQKAKEQRQGEQDDLKERIDDIQQAVPSDELSCSLAACDSNMDGLESLPDHVTSLLEPFQLPSTDEELDFEIPTDSGAGYNDLSSRNNEHRMLQRNSRRHIVGRWNLSSKPQRNHVSNGFHASQNSQLSNVQKHGNYRDSKLMPIINGNRQWSKKPKMDHGGDILKSRVEEEATTQPADNNKKHEVLIGSISVTLSNNCQQESKNFDGTRGDWHADHQLVKKNNVQDKHNRSDSTLCNTNRSTIKLWRPVSRNGNKGPTFIENGITESHVNEVTRKVVNNGNYVHSSSGDDNSSIIENGFPLANGSLHPGGTQFSCRAAKEFLAERWKEAINSEHVKLVLSSDSDDSNKISKEGTKIINSLDNVAVAESQDVKSNSPENHLDEAAGQDSSTAGAGKAKFRTKAEKGVKLKYVPKPRSIT